MSLSPARLVALTQSPDGRKLIRYSMVSVIAVSVSVVVLAILHGLLNWTAFWSNIGATAVAAVPSYELNRRWAWGKSGKSHLWKEVVPFWVLAFIGLAFSTYWAVAADHLAKSHHVSHLARTVIVEGAVISAFGVLWIAKFIIFNKILFVHHPQDLEPALDGRTGLPG
jgi:putative flippase GtrA